MNGNKARRIRKAVYGDHVSSANGRKYGSQDEMVMSSGGQVRVCGIRADDLRRQYQAAKKEWAHGVRH